MKDPSTPQSRGTKSSKLEDVTALAWNVQVAHVLATASTTGYTVVWDLRGQREVVALTYGGAGNMGGPMGGGMNMGGRRGMSDIAWHPMNVSLSLLFLFETCAEINLLIVLGYTSRDLLGRRWISGYPHVGSSQCKGSREGIHSTIRGSPAC